MSDVNDSDLLVLPRAEVEALIKQLMAYVPAAGRYRVLFIAADAAEEG